MPRCLLSLGAVEEAVKWGFNTESTEFTETLGISGPPGKNLRFGEADCALNMEYGSRKLFLLSLYLFILAVLIRTTGGTFDNEGSIDMYAHMCIY